MIPLDAMGSAMAGYLPLLLLTLVLELLVVAALAPAALRWRSLLVCLFLNLLTHPVATLTLLGIVPALWLGPLSFGVGFWLAVELLVTLAEYLGYRIAAGLSRPRALLLAVSCNLLTAMLSLSL